MLDAILGFGMSVLTGGATGLIGTGLSLIGDHFKRKQDLEMKKLDNDHEMAVMSKEWDGRRDIALTEADAAKDVQDGKAFAASYGLEPKRYLDIPGSEMSGFTKILLGFIDFWRGLIRPAMTTYLVVIVTLMYFEFLAMMEMKGITIDDKTVIGIVVHIVNSIVYLATTTTLWWFGTRNKNKVPKAA